MHMNAFYWWFTGALIISALFMPFWLTAVIFLVATFLLDKFYAGIVIMFVMDAIYGFEHFKVGPFYGMLTISSIVIFLLFSFLKNTTNIFKE